MKNLNFVKTMGFKVFNDDLKNVPVDGKILINTISPNSYGISTKDKEFRNALSNSDILVLDGVYFALGYFIKTKKIIKKNQGPDLTNFFLNKANNENLKVFFMGSSVDTLAKIHSNLKIKYPNIIIDSFSPPFSDKFTIDENLKILKSINDFKPHILFVGMTCPKQEKWSYKNKGNINANIICNIGAVFDWISGNQSEIHKIWWTLRLAWLKRTIDRPEIIKRYPSIFIYFKDMINSLLGINNIKLN